jgi:hypothetical protein
MDRNKIEKMIKEDWFKDHKAKLEHHGDLTVLVWRNPKSSFYYTRYVFDFNKIYITGDIGDAIFQIYDEVNLKKASELDIHYFHTKLIATEDEKWDFDSDVAIEYLKDKIKDLESDKLEWLGIEEDEAIIEDNLTDKQLSKLEEYNNYISTMNNLIELAESCSTVDNWKTSIYIDHLEELEEYDQDFYEWVFNIGNVIPSRVQGYLIGLQMALEQLESQQVSA